MTETFPIVPASSTPLWFLAAIAFLLVGLLVLFGLLFRSARHTRFVVGPEGLRIEGTLYGRRVPLSSLELERAEILDLRRGADRGVRWRTNGVGLPGYLAGWCRLRNGEKALAFVTDRRRVLYLPTREGFVLMVSARDPEGLLDALGSAAGSAS